MDPLGNWAQESSGKGGSSTNKRCVNIWVLVLFGEVGALPPPETNAPNLLTLSQVVGGGKPWCFTPWSGDFWANPSHGCNSWCAQRVWGMIPEEARLGTTSLGMFSWLQLSFRYAHCSTQRVRPYNISWMNRPDHLLGHQVPWLESQIKNAHPKREIGWFLGNWKHCDFPSCFLMCERVGLHHPIWNESFIEGIVQVFFWSLNC